MFVTQASPTWRQVGEATSPAPPALGFSTALVVEATAERVSDLLGVVARDTRHRRGTYGVRRDVAYRFHISGGTLALERTTPAYEPEDDTTHARMRQGLLWSVADDEPLPDEDAPARVITEWSRRSRARMVRALAEIDFDSWQGDTFAMVTLTLPGEWERVAPTGAHMKGALRRLRWRFERATGKPWQAAWKLEFQKRGAPHFHLLMKPPARVAGERFEDWLSRAWADCVGAEGDEYVRHVAAGTNVDYGSRTTDPKRVAVYFLKHSSKTSDDKEYQHIVPALWRSPGAGPGRFWGIAGLRRVRASVEIEARLFWQLRRELRKLHRAQRAKTALDRRRALLAQMVGETWRRPTLENLSAFGLRRDGLLRSAQGGGWVVLNDAPAVAHRMAEWLAARRSVAEGPYIGEPQGSP